LRARGDYEAALADLNQAVKLKPDEALFYSSRGYVKLSNNDPYGALADCTQAINMNSRLAVAYKYRAKAKVAIGDAASAMTDLYTAVRIDPSDEEVVQMLNELKKPAATPQAPR
jgi:hypothetical protein